MSFCQCGPGRFNYPAIGGLVLGGSPKVKPIQMKGGVVAGGYVLPSIPTQVGDQYAFIMHLIEQGEGVPDEYKNSVLGLAGGWGAPLANPVFIPLQTTDGLWNYANEFLGNSFIKMPEDSIGNNPITITLWAKITGVWQDRVFWSKGKTDNQGEGWQLQLGHNANNYPTARIQVEGEDDWNSYIVTSSNQVDFCWHHYGLIWNPGVSLSLYIDGVLEDTVEVLEKHLVPSTSGSYLGRVDNMRYAEGILQELRVAPVIKSEAWLQAEFDNGCQNSLYTVGDEESTVFPL